LIKGKTTDFVSLKGGGGGAIDFNIRNVGNEIRRITKQVLATILVSYSPEDKVARA
jgi:hypothetical protein